MELLDKVVQPCMQPSVARLPLLPGMPPTRVWVRPAPAASPARAEPLPGVAALPPAPRGCALLLSPPAAAPRCHRSAEPARATDPHGPR